MACSRPLTRFELQDGTWTGIRPREDRAILSEIQVGCGNCVLCRKQRSLELACRFEHEAQIHAPYNVFITGTYSDKNLPALRSLSRAHIDKFLQDLRNTARRKWNQAVRYDLIGEYSPGRQRPHWHGLFFGLMPPDATIWSDAPHDTHNYRSADLDACWPHGLITFQHFSAGAASYVANHNAFKKRGRALQEYLEVRDEFGQLLGHREPEWHLCSTRPGIGAGWFAKFGRQAIQNQFTVVGSTRHKTAIPRYYRKLAERDPTLREPLDALNAAAAAAAAGKPEDNTPDRLRAREEVETARQRAFHSRTGVHS